MMVTLLLLILIMIYGANAFAGPVGTFTCGLLVVLAAAFFGADIINFLSAQKLQLQTYLKVDVILVPLLVFSIFASAFREKKFKRQKSEGRSASPFHGKDRSEE